MLKGIWFKITAVMGGVIAVLVIALKGMRRKNKKLKHEVKIKDKKEEIRDKQEEAHEVIEKEKEKRIEERLKKRADLSKFDRLNRL